MSQDQKNLKYLCFGAIILGLVCAICSLVFCAALGKVHPVNCVISVISGGGMVYYGFTGAQKANSLANFDKYAKEATWIFILPCFMILDYFLYDADFIPQLVLSIVTVLYCAFFGYFVFSLNKKVAQK